MPPLRPVNGVTLSGRGLHSGRATSVTLAIRPGAVVLRTERSVAALSECEIARADHGVRVGLRDGSGEVDSVEHLCAALGALGVRRGVEVTVTGGEVPLLDGAALTFARALSELGPPADPPSLVVLREGTVEVGESSYAFSPAPDTMLDVLVDFAARDIGVQRARWDGSVRGFLEEIAWARTFGFRRDAETMFSSGRALGVDPSTVMVLTEDGRVEPPAAPARPGEFARHKLLDLVGDLYLFGGPPRGRISARKPGHSATHRAVSIARERGLLSLGGSVDGPGAW